MQAAKLKIWQKLLLACVVFAIPIGALLTMLIKQQNIAIAFAQKELDGTRYLRPIRDLLEDVTQDRLLARRSLRGDKAAIAALPAKRAEIETGLTALAAVDKALGEEMSQPDRQTGTTLQAIREDWKKLIGEQSAANPAASDAAHAALLVDLNVLLAHIGDTSNLILDPDLDSYYMMDSVLLKLPAGQDLLARLADSGEEIIARQKLTPDERIDLIVQKGLIQGNADGLDSPLIGMRVAIKNDSTSEKTLAPALEGPLAASLLATRQLLRSLDQNVLASGGVKLSPADFTAQAQAALAANLKLWDDSVAVLDQLLTARIAGFKQQQRASLAIVAVTVGAALLLVYLIVRGIARQVGAISALFMDVAMGDFAARAKVTSGDELGEIAASLNAMLDNVLSMPGQQAENEQELVLTK